MKYLNNLDTIAIIDLVGVVQGFTLGIVHIVINKKNRSTLLLGIFIICYVLDLIPGIFFQLGMVKDYPFLEFLPLRVSGLLFPLMYLYIQDISILSDRKPSYWTLIPSILFLVISSFLFFSPIDNNSNKNIVKFITCYRLFELSFSLYVGYLSIKWINLHIVVLKEQYANAEFKELRWLKNYIIYGMVFTIIMLFGSFVLDFNYLFKVTMSVINILLLFWLSIKGISQMNVLPLIASTEVFETIELKEANNQNFKPDQNPNYLAILNKIEEYLENQMAYTKPDLTVVDVAEYAGVHPKLVSTIINSSLNQNFNTYINSFRIQKAKELLLSEQGNHLSIEGIGIEVGFKSKSSFYGAFKQNVGCTPLQYKKGDVKIGF